MFRVFFCALVCNLSRFDGVFSSCARVFLPRLAGAPPRRFVSAAPCWRAAEVTRVRALLLSRRKYRLRRKVFLCRRVVSSPLYRVIPAMPFPPQLAGQSLRAIFPAARCAAGKIIFRKNMSFGKKRETGERFARRKRVKRRNREQCFGENFLTEMRCGGVFDRFFARRAKKRGGYFRIRLTGQGVSVTIEGEARKAPFG